MKQVLRLAGHTARVNELISSHWRVKHRLKGRDAAYVSLAAHYQGLARATGKRRVSLHVVLGPRQRVDEDCFWKSLLDALGHCGLLVNDSSKWCELGPVTLSRGPAPAMEVTLEDLP